MFHESEAARLRRIRIQAEMEHRYSRQHVQQQLADYLRQDEGVCHAVPQMVAMLEDYRGREYGYDSKNRRISEIQDIDMEDWIHRILMVTLLLVDPLPLTSVVGKLRQGLPHTDPVDQAKTMSEMLTVVAAGPFYLIRPGTRKTKKQWEVVSCVTIDDWLFTLIEQVQYLPPMVAPPRYLDSNHSSAWYTKERDCLILGYGNDHNDTLALDHLNRINQIPMRLHTGMLDAYREEPKEPFTARNDPEGKKLKQFNRLVTSSRLVYRELVKAGNRFYIPHKYDKRGRCYSQGYHCNPQGNAFRKAIVEFANTEVVTGVPEEYRLTKEANHEIPDSATDPDPP